mgnify:CR=1 FL=1
MKIALLGYGKMGKTIEQIAIQRGHQIVLKVDKDDHDYNITKADVAIDFSIPTVAFNNISNCINNQIPVISGTTGWLEDYNKAVALCKEKQGAFIYGGIDSRGIFRQSHSEATQFNDLGNPITSITDATEYGGSVGGICGFGWRFQDRIAIYTEALLNAQYSRTDRTFSVNGSITTLENKNNLKIVPMVPIALFLTIKF